VHAATTPEDDESGGASNKGWPHVINSSKFRVRRYTCGAIELAAEE